MKSFIFTIALFCFSFVFISKSDRNSKQEASKLSFDDCTFEDKKLYGKIRLVEYESQADISVKIVNSFPDIKVKFVENFADECGEWQIVDFGEDIRVYITENFADIKIKPVTSFPGLVK